MIHFHSARLFFSMFDIRAQCETGGTRHMAQHTRWSQVYASHLYCVPNGIGGKRTESRPVMEPNRKAGIRRTLQYFHFQMVLIRQPHSRRIYLRIDRSKNIFSSIRKWIKIDFQIRMSIEKWKLKSRNYPMEMQRAEHFTEAFETKIAPMWRPFFHAIYPQKMIRVFFSEENNYSRATDNDHACG